MIADTGARGIGGTRRRPSPLAFVAAAVLGGALISGLVVVLSTSRTAAGPGVSGHRLSVTAFEEQTGIRIARIALTAGTGLIDFRYQVLDPERAIVVHDRGSPPVIVDEKNQQVIAERFGHQGHTDTLHAGRTYFLLFVNRHEWVKRGDRASVKIGNFVLEHVPVQ